MAIFNRKKARPELGELTLPEHIGIIMDGNGRWAKKRGLPRSSGHIAGAKTFRKIARYCSDIGIRYLTVYAVSTENWRRPKDELDALMKLFGEYLSEALRDFRDDDIIVRFLGDRSAFSPELQELMRENEELSASRDGMVLNIAMNYGGRAELVHAFRDIAEDIKDNKLTEDDLIIYYPAVKVSVKSKEKTVYVYENKLDSIRPEIEYWNNQKAELEQIIRENRDVQDLQKQRDKSESNVNYYRSTIAKSEENLLRDFNSNACKFFALPLIKNTLKIPNILNY